LFVGCYGDGRVVPGRKTFKNSKSFIWFYRLARVFSTKFSTEGDDSQSVKGGGEGENPKLAT
jgi:hypothetical protein